MMAGAPAPPAQGFHHHGPRYINLPYFCMMRVLIKTDWSVSYPLCCSECWPWVGENNPSRSRLLSIWSKEV